MMLDGWRDEWMDRWIDGQMDGAMDGWTDKRMDGWPAKRVLVLKSRTRDQRDETAVRRAPDGVGVEPRLRPSPATNRIHPLPPIKAIRQGKLWNALKVLITINPVWEKW